MKQVIIKVVKVYGVFFSTLLITVVSSPVIALMIAVSIIRGTFDYLEDTLNKLLDEMMS